MALDINHLRYVVTIARLRSFSRAAEALYISQPGLSQQIAKLEKEIGFALFQRTTKHVQLTAEGTRFLTRAKRVLAEFDALEKQVDATRASMEHTINLGMSMIYRPDTSDTVARFIQAHPEIDINLVSAWELEMMDLLRSGRVDIGLFGVDWENDDLSGMTTIPIRNEYVVAAVNARHPLAQHASVSLKELADEPLIFSSDHSGVRRLVLQRFREFGLHPGKILEINETETRVHYVEQNIGVAFAMDSTYHWLGLEEVRRVLIEPRLMRTYALVIPNDGAARHPAAINLLQTFLLENLQKKPQDTLR